MKRTAILSTLLAFTVTMLASQAQAKFVYAKAGVGVGLAARIDVDTVTTNPFGAITQEDNTDLGTGFPLLLAVGFKFGPLISLEGEFSYRSASEVGTEVSFAHSHIGANIVFNIPLPLLPISPYFGGGALLQIPGYPEIDNIKVDWGSGFALQFFGGAYYDINALISIGLDLRYLTTIVGPSDDTSLAAITVDRTSNYSQLAAIANIMFGF